ncbi:TonB-dependent receptor [Limnobacter parvus]|uniref:TonB-dependent receptor n=1 Tax=Limnobacter parvus TaxID=2939690 RepID=A0ABT1XGW1_9BURK|nr:TonB-dependent receptor [Limnobacter parvus]MCR2745818.1 TonB-dependent receptor [Limnobacter parvus]
MPVHSQEELAFSSLPPVFVSSTQTAAPEQDPPFSTTVITSEQIRKSGYTTVRDVLSKLALVNVRTPLDGSRSASVDLRGFGETASANVVFVVDGVKLNDNEGVTPRYGSIPVSSIETIEVIRGGNSVAYGSGASGGVVRITTKKGRGREGVGGDVFASYGSYDTKELGATVYGGANGFSLAFNGSKETTNGYRDNSEASRDLGSLALDWQGDVYSAGASFSAEGSKSRFPGVLNRAQFEQNPKQTNNPNDFGKFDRNIFRFYGIADYGSWGSGIRLSRRKHDSFGSFGGFPVPSSYEQDQISPYLTFTLKQGEGAHNVRIGYDIEKAALRGFNSGTLESNAVFIEDDWTVNEVVRINTGSRYERSEQQKLSGETREYSLLAHQLGVSWNAAEALTLYTKYSRSFRIPNADENGFAGFGTTQVPFLNPQVADELEAGFQTNLFSGEFAGSVFLMDVENELFNDPSVVISPFFSGANTNLDALRRTGGEFRWSGEIYNDLRLAMAYQYIDAEFRSGNQSGGRVPLVSAHNLKVSTEYDWNSKWSSEAIFDARSNQRAAGDTDLQVPGYGVLDINLRMREESYSLVLQVQNLFDKSYYRQQFQAGGIYPEIGRAVFLSFNSEF